MDALLAATVLTARREYHYNERRPGGRARMALRGRRSQREHGGPAGASSVNERGALLDILGAATIGVVLSCCVSVRAAEVGDARFDELRAELDSRGFRRREAAAMELAKLGKRGAAALAKALDEEHPDKQMLLRALGAAGPAALPHLKTIVSKRSKLAYIAATAAYRADRDNSASILVDALDHTSASCSRSLAEVLTTMGPCAVPVVPRILKRAKHPRFTRTHEVNGFRFGSASAVCAAAWGMKDRAKAAKFVREALELSPHHPSLCRNAFRTLARSGRHAREGLPCVAANLSRKVTTASNEWCYEFLEEIGQHGLSALPQLSRIVAARSDGHLVYLIGRMGPPARSVLPLLRSFRTKYKATGRGRSAERAIAEITDRNWYNFSKLAAKPVSWTDLRRVAERGVAARHLAPAVKKHLKHRDPLMRCEAARTYWKLTGNSKEVFPLLRKMLKDKKAQKARYRTCEVLAEMGPSASAAVPELIACLGWRVTGVGAAESPDGREVIKWEMRETDNDLRERAMWALFNIGPGAKPALPALKKVASGHEKYLAGAARWVMQAVSRKADGPGKGAKGGGGGAR